MKPPVIFLTFANDRDEHLALLNRERKNIIRVLRKHDDEGLVKLITDASATLEDIFEVFREYEDQVTIFHYGGHATGSSLKLEADDGSSSSAQALGLAQFLGQQKSLKLVFLNGCATKPQVEVLLKHGVPAVIATATKIKDNMATEFAEQFYYSLANFTTVERAFALATAFVNAKYKDFGDISLHRDLSVWGEQPDASLPWGLYGSDSDESLEWSLPKSIRGKAELRNRYNYETKNDVNDILIDLVCEALAEYSKDLDYELSKEQLVIPAIIREIVDCFPLPIGEQLRKLFTRSNDPSNPDEMELFTLPRLQQLYITYRATAQFISYILLAQLWDEKFKKPDIDFGDTRIVEFNSFFTISEETYNAFDYIALIRTITDIFDKHQLPYFIDELQQIKENVQSEHEVYDASVFMNNLYSDITSELIPPDKMEEVCLHAEEQLGIVLKGFAFLAKYKLATIKNIEIIKRRHETAQYRHNHIELNRAITIANTPIVEVGEVFNNFTDNKCVLFIKTKENEILDYLSLSPFIIDLNALNKEHSSKLYVFQYQSKGQYYFQFLNNIRDKKLIIDDENFKFIKEEFEKFKATLHGSVFEKKAVPVSKSGGSRFSRKK